MFRTANVRMYLQDAFPDIDGEKRVIKLRCYVNPVSFDLCAEVDEDIARTLFQLMGRDWLPRLNVSHCKFAISVPVCSLTYSRDPEHANSRVFIPAVTISKLEAGKVTPESNDWALMFTVSFEKHDPQILNDLSDLLHEHFYCTFAALQPGLPGLYDEWAVNHDRDIEAASGVAESIREEAGETEEPRADPLEETGEFINRRAKERKRKARAKHAHVADKRL